MSSETPPVQRLAAHYVIVFVDIRGFTSWSERQDVVPFLADFVSEFQKQIKDTFEKCDSKLFDENFTKNQGDGALIILRIKDKLDEKLLTKTISAIIKSITTVTGNFDKLCKKYAKDQGCDINLELGWGVTKGVIQPSLDGDYIGAEINKSARLCDMARPFGIVIDKNDFQTLPKNSEFFSQSRKLKGISADVDVWVTKQISTSFITREQIRLTPEVHVAGLCYNVKAGKVLIAKRNCNRKLFPGKYEGCGGQLAPNESFCDGVKRHFKQELGIEVKVLGEIHEFYTINQANEAFIPGIMFLCLYENGNFTCTNHSEFKWVLPHELSQMNEADFVPDLQRNFASLHAKYAKIQAISP